jgi:hypothetical protein
MKEEILKEIQNFLAVAKELNYDLVALYEKEPMIMQIIGGSVVVLIIFLMILKSMLSKSGANKALVNMDNTENDFEDYQNNIDKIIKVLPGAKEDFLNTLKENREKYVKAQLNTLAETTLDVKIEKYQRMSRTYSQLASASRDEELAQYYEDMSKSILENKLNNEISSYMNSFEFNDENMPYLEAIVEYANNQDEPDSVISIVTTKLNRFNFASSLELFKFIRDLDSDRLAQVYDYCIDKQNQLFIDGNSVVAGDVLEYLLDNGEREKVLDYIKNLKVATYLQELKYKYFSQKDDLEFDLAFIANTTPITQNYANYLENKVTENWRDSDYLDTLLSYENVTNVLGDDRARLVIERIDLLRKEYDEKEILNEALQTAQEAKQLAKEAKELALQNLNNAKEEEKNKEEDTKQENS